MKTPWLSVIACFVVLLAPGVSTPGSQSGDIERVLPKDVDPDSRSRLPAIRREALDERGKKAYDAAAAGNRAPQGAAALRLHGSGTSVRWASPLGRALTELAILTTAREHDQPYEWSLHEMEALAVGLDPATIDIVRHRKPATALGDREAIIIQMGREIFRSHKLGSDTYARAVKTLGRANLVDVIDLMGTYSATAARLTAFNQHMPPGWKQFLPLSFTPPSDIHEDSRSRLPLFRSQGQAASPTLYSRTLAPEGTGPGHIARHAAGLKSLEASVGPRLIKLAMLVTAREHNAQYEWTLTESAALKERLEPAVIDVVRYRRSVKGLVEKDAVIIEFGRELFGKHNVTAELYARALKAFGERDLVDLVGVMAQQAADAVVVSAFDQHLPAGVGTTLPVP
jgi:4-carboxymuconolactone decarboxylase